VVAVKQDACGREDALGAGLLIEGAAAGDVGEQLADHALGGLGLLIRHRHLVLSCCRCGVLSCAWVGEASGEVLDVGQSHMRGLATPGPWFRRWRTLV
jgi:hypothetical protein